MDRVFLNNSQANARFYAMDVVTPNGQTEHVTVGKFYNNDAAIKREFVMQCGKASSPLEKPGVCLNARANTRVFGYSGEDSRVIGTRYGGQTDAQWDAHVFAFKGGGSQVYGVLDVGVGEAVLNDGAPIACKDVGTVASTSDTITLDSLPKWVSDPWT